MTNDTTPPTSVKSNAMIASKRKTQELTKKSVGRMAPVGKPDEGSSSSVNLAEYSDSSSSSSQGTATTLTPWTKPKAQLRPVNKGDPYTPISPPLARSRPEAGAVITKPTKMRKLDNGGSLAQDRPLSPRAYGANDDEQSEEELLAMFPSSTPAGSISPESGSEDEVVDVATSVRILFLGYHNN